MKGIKYYTALIDTGATSTMITRTVVNELALQSVGKIPFQDVNGPQWRKAYLFHIAFYEGDVTDLLHMDDGDQHAVHEKADEIGRTHVFTKPINGAEIGDTPSFDVLLGMDVLTSGTLQINPTGTFFFSF